MNQGQNENKSKLNLRLHLSCFFGLVAFLFLAFLFAKQIEPPFVAGRMFGAFAISGFILTGWGIISYAARTGVWWTSVVILNKPLNKNEKIAFTYGVPTFLLSGIWGGIFKHLRFNQKFKMAEVQRRLPNKANQFVLPLYSV